MAQQSKIIRILDRVATILVRLALIGVLIFVFFLVYLFLPSWPRKITDPAAEFTTVTGLRWPDSAQVNRANGTSIMSSEGDWIIEFTANSEELKTWLSQTPPWGGDKWLEAAVPEEVLDVRAPQIAVYSANRMLCAEDLRHTSLPWHNGRSLTVDLTKGLVTLRKWDY